jgi:hypothetical protein
MKYTDSRDQLNRPETGRGGGTFSQTDSEDGRYRKPVINNLIQDPKQLYPVDRVDVSASWVFPVVLKRVLEFQKTLMEEPPIRLGTPDPYVPTSTSKQAGRRRGPEGTRGRDDQNSHCIRSRRRRHDPVFVRQLGAGHRR